MKLIFVYNANSGKLNSYLDSIHKVMSPSTYDCNLCAITHGAIKENELWKAFRENSSHEMLFYHKDEFENAHQEVVDKNKGLPAIFTEKEGAFEAFISKKELDDLTSAEALIEAIMKRSSAR